MKNSELNIHNLGQLWKIAGKASDGFQEKKGYSISFIENSQWPNRIWVNNNIPKTLIHRVKSEMSTNTQLTFSHFKEGGKETDFFNDNGFELKSIQYGMSLHLSSKFKLKKSLILERISDTINAKLWSKAFHDSFQYKISTKTIIQTSNDIQYYLVKNEETLIGTIILFATNNVIGIHGLGIIPAQRTKGYGKEIMYNVLNMAIDQNFDLATLQASEMAKNMYAKMGFSYDFIMENYTLKE